MKNQNFKTQTVSITELQPHPFTEKMYQVKGIAPLKKSIAKDGMIELILTDKRHRILAGRRRWLACKELGWTAIPVKVLLDDITEAQAEHIIINSNMQRKKTVAEIINEVEYILGTLGKNQGQRRDLLAGADDDTFGKIGKDRYEIAAEMIGNDMSAATLRRLMHIVEFERKYPAADLGLVEKVVKGEMSINGAFKLAKNYPELIKEKDGIGSGRVFPAEKSTGKYTIYNKSSLNMAGEIADNTIQMVMTSTPYFNVRKYGLSGKPELGLEKSYAEYIANLTNHFREIYRVLSPTGSFFLNIGDTYSKKENYLISARLVLAACDQAGFHCVNEIIWSKTNTIPHTTKRRLQPSYEKIYHLVKDPNKYYYEPFKYADSDKEIKLDKIKRRNRRGGFDIGEHSLSKPYKKFKDFIKQQEFEDIIVSSSAGADSAKLHKLDPTVDHPAIFPSSICLLPILTTTKPGDTVLDPFSGTGSLGEVCLLFGVDYIGYEIEERFSKVSVKRLDAVEKDINPGDMAFFRNHAKASQTIDITDLANTEEKAA